MQCDARTCSRSGGFALPALALMLVEAISTKALRQVLCAHGRAKLKLIVKPR
jgi:hypothetical protein